VDADWLVPFVCTVAAFAMGALVGRALGAYGRAKLQVKIEELENRPDPEPEVRVVTQIQRVEVSREEVQREEEVEALEATIEELQQEVEALEDRRDAIRYETRDLHDVLGIARDAVLHYRGEVQREMGYTTQDLTDGIQAAVEDFLMSARAIAERHVSSLETVDEELRGSVSDQGPTPEPEPEKKTPGKSAWDHIDED
jgi:chromosome segregation ATPase